MSLTTCAAFLLFLTVVNAICCPCFIATRKGMSSWKGILTAILLLYTDVVFVVVNIMEDLIVDALLASALLTGIGFRFAQRKKPHLRKEKELLFMYHDPFWDPFDIFSGSGGCLNYYCVITASVLNKLLPSIGFANILLYLLYILRSLTSLKLLMVPAIFGDNIQSMKLMTKLVADWRTKRIDHRDSKDEMTFL